MRRFSFLTYIVVVVALLGWGRLEAAEEASNLQSKNIATGDGVVIAIHYYPDILSNYTLNTQEHIDTILKSAKEAYNDIVYKYGFKAPGFTYANPDKNYCYDKDKTIDIYVGGGNMQGALRGFTYEDFLDAPCYDIVKGNGNDYDAVILFPADYKGSSVRGTLFHEMLHIIVYSYNKNIAPWYRRYKNTDYHKGGDWYVEGLARYFETKADSYDEFFSKGFKAKENGKTILSQKGANYLMSNPSESLKDARYDYSLFWAYIDQKYGMEKIEELSRKFRYIQTESMEKDLPRIFTQVIGDEFESLIKEFAVCMYFKFFNPDIRKGLSDLKVMTLNDFSNKSEKKIDSWASNFIKFTLNDKDTPSMIKLKKTEQGGELKVTIFAGFSDGKIKQIKKLSISETDMACQMELQDMKQSGVENLILIITNTNHTKETGYQILQS